MHFSGKGLASAMTGVALATVLTACGGASGSEDIPEASPPVSDSASPASNEPSSPVQKPTLPDATDTVAGQKAFARYVARAWEYAIATNDASALLLADPDGTCTGCQKTEQVLASREKDGWYIDDPGMTIKAEDLVRKQGGVRLVGMAVSLDANRSMNRDGTVRSRNKPTPRLYFEVGMTFEADHYQITDYSISE